MSLVTFEAAAKITDTAKHAEMMERATLRSLILCASFEQQQAVKHHAHMLLRLDTPTREMQIRGSVALIAHVDKIRAARWACEDSDVSPEWIDLVREWPADAYSWANWYLKFPED